MSKRSSPPPSGPPATLPFEVLADLSGDGRVVRAIRNGREVVVRRGDRSGRDELLTELAVLAGIDHPGLSRWVDHGTTPDGETWLAREWVEGTGLDSWAQGRAPEEVGAQVVHLAIAVDALHESGFVHADLKPENVIVRPDGRPVLTDFGLARVRAAPGGASERAASGVAGTLYAIAPEVLLGALPGPAADVFALGVLAHRLWVGRRASAREFYAAFPRKSFFEASATAPEDLPEWARDVVAGMLLRDPEERLAAAEVARRLAARLGLGEVAGGLVARARPRWRVRRGRDEWLARMVLAVRSGEAHWVRARPGEARGLAAALALDLGAAGEPVQCVDVGRECASLAEAADLDRWAAERARGGIPTVAFREGTAVRSLRAAQHLARGLRAAGVAVVLLDEGSAVPSGWSEESVPDPDEAARRAFLEEVLPREAAERREELALWMGGEVGSARLDAALERAVRDGLLLPAESGWRLRPGRLPAPAEPGGAASLAGLSPPARSLFLACLARPDSAAAQTRLAGLEPGGLGAAANELVAAGLARRFGDGSGRLLGVAAPGDLESADRLRLAELLAAEAERGPPGLAARTRAWAAGRAATAEIEAGLLESLEAGRPEQALEALDEVERLGLLVGRELPCELVFLRGRMRTALGEIAPVRAEADALERAGRTDLAECLRGHAALAAHDFAAAERHFTAAGAERGGAHALYARVRRAFEEHRHREVVDAVDALEGRGEFPPRLLANLRTLRAMSELHSGNVARAGELLARELECARSAGDSGREAALLLNRATLERRTGKVERALEDFRRSVELHDQAGLLSGLAQARGQLGGLLRELGRSGEAEQALRSAVELRERLGDRGGALAARGMLGLVQADRGHVRAALAELDRAARGLRELGRPGAAELFEARAELLRTRIGHVPRPERGARADDPRVPLWRARAAWLRGDGERAQTLAVHARHLAESLGRSSVAAEARMLLAAASGGEPPEDVVRAAPSAARDDHELRRWLASAPRDATRGRELAERLAESGRDALAARLWMALAAEGVLDARERAQELFGRCAAGLGRSEAALLAGRLTGGPDPRPADLECSDATDEEDDLDTLSLLDINHQLLEQEDVDPLLGTIVEKALQVSGAERGFLVLEEDGCLRLDRALDTSRGELDQPDVEISGSIVRRALSEMQPVLVSDALDDPLLASAPSVANLELRSVLCAPFQVHEGLRGAIWVDHRLRTGAFTERDQRLLGLLADQAGLAILQVVRLEEIRRLNERLQRKVVRRESDLRAARRALEAARVAVPASGLVGSSAVMQAVHAAIGRAAPTSLPVLVTGESGTGKELAARALHAGGVRAQGPLVVENCAALPPSLIESELFGYRRGAFTGADDDRPGLFERAHGGTLFLDEIGELQPELQAKLLRVLETGEVRRIGDSEPRRVDVRLVCATNRDLEEEVRAGRFRADLFYRLDGLRIRMPALSERAGDIPELVEHFLRMEEARGGPVRQVSAAVLARLARRSWPGNVRELQNEVARLCVLSEGDLVDPDLVRAPGPVAEGSDAARVRVLPMAQIEREAILRALEATGGDKRRAAELLGISRAKIYQRLKAWAEESEAEEDDPSPEATPPD